MGQYTYILYLSTLLLHSISHLFKQEQMDDNKYQKYSTKSFNSSKHEPDSASIIKLRISEKLKKLDTIRPDQINDFISFAQQLLSSLIDDLQLTKNILHKDGWKRAQNWIMARTLLPEKANELGSILDLLSNSKIILADVAKRGTQLKLLFKLQGGQLVLFKPKRYSVIFTKF